MPRAFYLPEGRGKEKDGEGEGEGERDREGQRGTGKMMDCER